MRLKATLAGALVATLVSGAASAETLRLLTWGSYAPEEVIRLFEEKYPDIKVEVTFSNNEEMIAKLRATGGAGTAASRYVVTDAFGLQGIGSAGYAGAHYALGADIAASGTAGWNLGEGFRPIGNRGTPFSGSLDGATAAGGRHAISGLAQVVSSGPGGLFGIIAGATIQNLRLLDIALEARQSFAPVAGGLVGETQAGAAPNVIENVLVTGRIAAEMGEDSVSSASFGGLVGLFGDGRILHIV